MEPRSQAAEASSPGTPGPYQGAIDRFIRRLNASITRSPLLKASTRRTGRLIDVSRFGRLDESLPERIITALVSGERGAPLDFDLRELREIDTSLPGVEAGEGADPLVKEQRALYSQLESIRRIANLAQRETGVHALWLGYPLLYMPSGPGVDDQWVLAPLFLFPSLIVPNVSREGRITLKRADVGPPRFNTALAAWVTRVLKVELPRPTEDDLESLDVAAVHEWIPQFANAFRPPPFWDGGSGVAPVPETRSLSTRQGARFFRAAALGIFRWQNEAILADLESLKARGECPRAIRPFLEGERVEKPASPLPVPEADRFFVADADFSQQRVVWSARDAKGIVVHGPPGTGKSQTIVNIIADALAHGQTVLMVCQKEAATRVVAKRLEQAGLCGREDQRNLVIELHDAETDRQAIFKAIRTQVDTLPGRRAPAAVARRAQLSRDIEAAESDLDAFARGMHEPHAQIGLAYRDVLALEARFFREAPQVRPLPALSALADQLGAVELDPLLSLVRRAGELVHRAAFLANPWRHRQPAFDLTPSVQADLSSILDRSEQLDAEHQGIVQDAGPGFTLPATPLQFREHAQPMLQQVRQACSMPRLHRSMLAAWLDHLSRLPEPDVEKLTSILNEAVVLADKVAHHPLDPAWQEALRGSSDIGRREVRAAAEMLLNIRQKWWRHFSWDYHRAKRVLRSRRPDAIGPALFRVAAEGVSHFNAADDHQRLLATAATLHPKFPNAGGGIDDAESFVRTASAAFESARDFLAALRARPWLAPLAEPLHLPDAPFDESLATRVRQCERRADVADRLVAELNKLSQFLAEPAVAPLLAGVLAGASTAGDLAAIRDGLSRLDSLRSLEGLLAGAQGPARDALVALLAHEGAAARGEPAPRPGSIESPESQGRWWTALAGYSIAVRWRAMVRERHPALDRMNPDDAAELAATLAALLAEKRTVETRVILDLWQERQQRIADFPWQTVFKLRGSRGAPAPKLREAVHHSVRNGLLDLRPCWLTNPAAAAQVFPLEEGLFDVVIFDEASQCPIEQAIPSLCRANRAVISGDEKQLPPTSFFSPDDDAGADEEEEDEVEVETPEQRAERLRRLTAAGVVESEDLLRAAIGVLPEAYLLVHYRSEHPALIAFSNRAFYAGLLEIPPARMDSGAATRPIEYIPAAGLYERRRINRAEAERVVQAIKQIITASDKTPTLGVDNFNQPQRELIQDLLETERLRDPVFAARYEEELNRRDDNQDVGLFVKNLENVQGDERDLMLFSTTFGVNDEGKFRRYFGPVGQEGGERRLNVAVTRAKKRVIVVGSMPVDQITPLLRDGAGLDSAATPAAYLQFYLAYAQAIHDGDAPRAARILDRLGARAPAVAGAEYHAALADEVRDALTGLGYTVHARASDSVFAFDLAVLHPDPSRGYILGIECDAGPYHPDRSARIRDIWRREVLGRRGWKIHRVWSSRWWQSKETELEHLRRLLETPPPPPAR